MIFVKIFQLSNYDLMKTGFYYQAKKYNFNISTYLVFNLCFCLSLFNHYYMFNYIFYSQSSPCFGGDQTKWFSSTSSMFTNTTYVSRVLCRCSSTLCRQLLRVCC